MYSHDSPSRLPGLVGLLALIGLVYLLLAGRQGPPEVSGWRGAASIAGEARPLDVDSADASVPSGNPLRDSHTVLTQGYGVGSHVPAAVWGALDMAIDGDDDGVADPQGTAGAPIYATHDGVAQVRPNTWPAGNYLAIVNAQYKTAFAHLARYAVADGAAVRRGQVVGYVGATGQASGPHLHYEIWNQGVNVDPTDYGALNN